MSGRTLRLGTRASALALAQTGEVASLLRRAFPSIKIQHVEISTQGDRNAIAPIEELGGKGAFTSALTRALIEKEIDAAVHSLKDLPVDQPEGVVLTPIPLRADPRDVLAANGPADWRTEALRVGTSSPRRKACLLEINPALECVPIRGNVPARLGKLQQGGYDVLVLALAGVRRLDLELPWAESLDPETMLPAPGQGALGIQVRAGDVFALECFERIGDAQVTACCLAERAVLRGLGGSCLLPMGALGRIQGGAMHLSARVWAEDGSRSVGSNLQGGVKEPELLGEELANMIRLEGGESILGRFPG